MHDLTEEDLRQIWLDLYLDAVKSSNCITPAIVHGHARETADAYVALLRADMNASLKATAEMGRAAREAASNGEAVVLPSGRTAEDERRDVLAYIDAVDAGSIRDVIAYDKSGDRAAAMRSYELGKVVAGIRFDIDRGDHVGAADREAVKP